MNDNELEEYLKTIEPNFDSHIEKGTIEMSNEYYNLLEERMIRLLNENKQLKEELQQFQYDFEKQEAEVFNELEQAINELDLSDKTKEYLIDLMNKDVNIVFGIVEDKIQELKEKYK